MSLTTNHSIFDRQYSQMIYHPHQQHKLTQKEEEIYSRIIDRHRKFVNEKYTLIKRPNSHIFQFRYKPKSRFYEESRENQFMNTLFNKYKAKDGCLSLSQLEKIPAQQFLDLCAKLQNMTMSKIDTTTPQKSKKRSIPSHIKRVSQKIQSAKKVISSQNRQSLDKNMQKLIPKLPKLGPITNRQFFELFYKKCNEAKKIKFIKEQIELEAEYENYTKVEAIMNARKSAKQWIIRYQLVNYFKNTIDESTVLGKNMASIIKTKLPDLQKQVQEQQSKITSQQKSKIFSINSIRLNRHIKRVTAFKQIINSIDEFNLKIGDYYEGELLVPLSIRQLRNHIEYYNDCVRYLASSINKSLGLICQEFTIEPQELQSKKQENHHPQQSSTITNSYAFNEFRQFHQEFLAHRCLIQMLYQHLQKVINIKDLLTQTQRKRGNTNKTKMYNTKMINIRIS